MSALKRDLWGKWPLLAQSSPSSKRSRLISGQQPISISFATLKKHLGRHAEQDLPDRLEMGAACLDLLRERVHVAEAALERAAREDRVDARSLVGEVCHLG